MAVADRDQGDIPRTGGCRGQLRAAGAFALSRHADAPRDRTPAVCKASEFPAFTRFNLFLRDRFTCQYCGSQQHLTFDHVIPRRLGGRTTWENITTACALDPDDARVFVGDLLDASWLVHEVTAGLYRAEDDAPFWAEAAARDRLAAVLAETSADGLTDAEHHADRIAEADRDLARAHTAWAAHTDAARDTLTDPRPAALARLDVTLTDAALATADALRGRRADAARLYPGTWFPTVRDSSDIGFGAVASAVTRGDAEGVAEALDALRPPHDGYRRLRARLAALDADLPPVPAGPELRTGDRSVRVPHVRARLAALGYLDDEAEVWARSVAFLLDSTLARGLARFEADRRLAPDAVLDAQTLAAINADTGDLRARIALNLERWRWLPDDLGDRYIHVNLPSFDLRVVECSDSGYVTKLEMPANIGNAQTTG